MTARRRQGPMGSGGHVFDVACAAVYGASGESRYAASLAFVIEGVGPGFA